MKKLVLIARNGDCSGWFVKENHGEPKLPYVLTQNREEAKQFLPNDPKMFAASEFWRIAHGTVTEAIPLSRD